MGHRDDNHANLWVTIVISFIQDPCLTAMLCPTCTGALRLREGRIRNDERESYGREMGIHHKTARDLRDSALNIGCYTCRIVWDDLTPSEQNQLMSLDEKSTRNVTQWFLLDLDDMIPNSIASGLGMRADIPTLGFIIGFGDGVSRLGNRDNPTSVFVLWPSSGKHISSVRRSTYSKWCILQSSRTTPLKHLIRDQQKVRTFLRPPSGGFGRVQRPIIDATKRQHLNGCRPD